MKGYNDSFHRLETYKYLWTCIITMVRQINKLSFVIIVCKLVFDSTTSIHISYTTGTTFGIKSLVGTSRYNHQTHPEIQKLSYRDTETRNQRQKPTTGIFSRNNANLWSLLTLERLHRLLRDTRKTVYTFLCVKICKQEGYHFRNLVPWFVVNRTPQQNQKIGKIFLLIYNKKRTCVFSTTTQQGRSLDVERLCTNFGTQGEEEAQKIKGIAWNKKERYRYIQRKRHVGNTRSNNKFELQKRIDHSLHKRKNTD